MIKILLKISLVKICVYCDCYNIIFNFKKCHTSQFHNTPTPLENVSVIKYCQNNHDQSYSTLLLDVNKGAEVCKNEYLNIHEFIKQATGCRLPVPWYSSHCPRRGQIQSLLMRVETQGMQLCCQLHLYRMSNLVFGTTLQSLSEFEL